MSLNIVEACNNFHTVFPYWTFRWKISQIETKSVGKDKENCLSGRTKFLIAIFQSLIAYWRQTLIFATQKCFLIYLIDAWNPKLLLKNSFGFIFFFILPNFTNTSSKVKYVYEFSSQLKIHHYFLSWPWSSYYLCAQATQSIWTEQRHNDYPIGFFKDSDQLCRFISNWLAFKLLPIKKLLSDTKLALQVRTLAILLLFSFIVL